MEQPDIWATIGIYAMRLFVCCLFALGGRQHGKKGTLSYQKSGMVLYCSWLAFLCGLFIPYGNWVQFIASYLIAMAIFRRRAIRDQSDAGVAAT